MDSDHRFSAEVSESDPQEKKEKSGWSTCLTGCLIAVLVMIVLIAIALFWVSRNWREWASNYGAQALKQVIDESQLPVQEKVEIKVQIDRVADAVREGRVSREQLGTLMQTMLESPLMTSFVAAAVESQYFDKSDLSDEEKSDGKRTVRRFLRGTIDGKIDQQGIDAAMSHVADREANDNWKLRKQVSDEELRAFLAEAKAQADEAGVAEEPEDVDPSDEVKRIVDEVLGDSAPAAPADPADRQEEVQMPAAKSSFVPPWAIGIAASSIVPGSMPGSPV